MRGRTRADRASAPARPCPPRRMRPDVREALRQGRPSRRRPAARGRRSRSSARLGRATSADVRQLARADGHGQVVETGRWRLGVQADAGAGSGGRSRGRPDPCAATSDLRPGPGRVDGPPCRAASSRIRWSSPRSACGDLEAGQPGGALGDGARRDRPAQLERPPARAVHPAGTVVPSATAAGRAGSRPVRAPGRRVPARRRAMEQPGRVADDRRRRSGRAAQWPARWTVGPAGRARADARLDRRAQARGIGGQRHDAERRPRLGHARAAGRRTARSARSRAELDDARPPAPARARRSVPLPFGQTQCRTPATTTGAASATPSMPSIGRRAPRPSSGGASAVVSAALAMMSTGTAVATWSIWDWRQVRS